MCETCKNTPVKLGNSGKFTPFCGFVCSRASGSSTFIKAKQTCLEKYGAKSNLSSSSQIEARRKNGGLGLSNPNIRKLVKETNLKRYGVENVFAADSVKEKIKATHDNRYGGNYHTITLGKKLDALKDAEYCKGLASQYCLSTISNMLGVASNTVYRYFSEHGISNFKSQRSNQEVEMLAFLKSLGLSDNEIVCNDRSVLGNRLELDLFIPSKKLAIELNGLYWHSDKAGCSMNYHKNKMELAAKKGIRLITIFENEWVMKKEQVQSRLRAILGLNQKIAARKCIVRDVSTTEKRVFLEKSHLQGDCQSSINLGLYHNDTIYAIATFSKTRFDKSADYELIRFACEPGYTVVGGFNKLISAFKHRIGHVSIVSYADSRWSYGDVYKSNGFTYMGDSAPSYFYFKNSTLVLENRMKFQKHKLHKLLPNFDASLSERENMKNAGYNRIWDCGTTKWILNK